MIVALSLLGMIFFGLAGLLGIWLSPQLCRNTVPFDDGPSRVSLHPWILVSVAAGIGIPALTHNLSFIQIGTLFLAVTALVAATVSDCALGIIPDAFTILPLVIIVLAFLAQHRYTPILSALIIAIPFAAIAYFSHGRGLGWGDVKLASLGGVVLGLHEAIIALMLASLAAFAVSKFSGIHEKPVAFVPYLAGGVGVMLFFRSSF